MGNATEKPVAVEAPVEAPVLPWKIEENGTEEETETVLTIGNGTGPRFGLAGGVTIERDKSSDGTGVLKLDAGVSGVFVLAGPGETLEDAPPRSGGKAVKTALTVSLLAADWSAFVAAVAAAQSRDGSSVEVRCAGVTAVTRDRAKEILTKRFSSK